ncbi:MAG: thiolase C-terminal domain-containing protein [Thermoplasmatota archaeon]
MDSGRDVLITGIGLAKMQRAARRPFYEVAHDAASRALANAQLTAKDIDSVVLAGLDVECGRTISNMYVAPAAGGYQKDEIRVADDGLFAAALAWMRIRAGLFGRTMVLAYGQSSEASPDLIANLVHEPVLDRPFGLGRLAPLAMQAAAYSARREDATEAADLLVELNSTAGAANADTLAPPARRAASVVQSPFAATPLRKAHVAPLADGAAALILEPDTYARRPLARVAGFGWAAESGQLGERDLATSDASERAALDAFATAGLTEEDVERAEVHDLTTYHELIALEALGLVAGDDAPRAVLQKEAGPTGNLVVNASGGSLAGEPSVASGLYRLAWAVRAIAACDAKVALAHSMSGPAGQQACVGLVGGI